MKFAIVGTGGTGAILGTYLSLAGNDVTFIARGAHLEAMKKNGLLLRTSHRGDIHLQPIKTCTMGSYEDIPDVILICVKYYSIPEAIKFVRRAARPKTLVIPILNVFGTGEVMQKELPGITVCDGCVYIYGLPEAPGIVAQPSPILRLFYGFRNQQEDTLRPLAEKLAPVLNEAGIEGHFSSNIRRDALEKFSFVSPLGAAGLYFDAVCGDFCKAGPQRTMLTGLIQEIEALGHAMGIRFKEDLTAKNLQLLNAFTPDLHTSMQRDVARGGPSEFSGLVHRVAALGKKYYTSLPLYQKISDWGAEHHIK